MKFTPNLSKHFEHTCSVDTTDHYILKEDLECWANSGKLVIYSIAVDRSTGEITHVRDEERGLIEASPGMELSIYRRSIKHLGTFRT